MSIPLVFQPDTADEIAGFLRDWSVADKSVRLRGGGSKAGFGRPLAGETILDLSNLSGITLYEPGELVLTARAGTKISEIEAAIGEHNQCMAFEPPVFGPLFGTDATPTLGGTVASGWSGPRRMKAGAVRDHVLGALAVGGDGQVFKSGGRVVKNVTGFDLPKLLTGSHGTLAALTDITIKVLPAPEATRTLAIHGLDDAAAIRLLCDLVGGPYEVSGAAHLPAFTARYSAIAEVANSGRSATLIRLEGFGPSVSDRLAALQIRCGQDHPAVVLEKNDCLVLWREVRDVAPLVAPDRIVWRLSLPPADAASTVAAIKTATGSEVFYDWGGGLVWLTLPPGDAHADTVRGLLPSGHATLMRASADIRAAAPVFQPPEPALEALQARVKAAFDPSGILAPGFMGTR
ncbi:MAG TPA: FAD-binding protein [Alphaproteobacteria bacterium]|jgi:glycolate oxidase FAD binding subunit|nr:FAD-binding protein [Alphaproteobacteria bacterium]